MTSLIPFSSQICSDCSSFFLQLLDTTAVLGVVHNSDHLATFGVHFTQRHNKGKNAETTHGGGKRGGKGFFHHIPDLDPEGSLALGGADLDWELASQLGMPVIGGEMKKSKITTTFSDAPCSYVLMLFTAV